MHNIRRSAPGQIGKAHCKWNRSSSLNYSSKRARRSARIDAVDGKLSAKLDALTIAVSRLEGAVYHGLPEPRRTVSEQ